MAGRVGRPVGRPRKNPEGAKTESKKKGKPAWKPAARLDLLNKDSNYRYRWCSKDLMNLQTKQQEGWVFVNKETGIPAEHDHPGHVSDGKPLTSAKEYRELVAMALPEEAAKARDEYFKEKTDRQTAGLKKQLQDDLDQMAQKEGSSRSPAHGTIVIE